jgi:hypothetical protein
VYHYYQQFRATTKVALFLFTPDFTPEEW